MVDRIRALLLARQLSPTQFADAIGVARPIVSHIMSGRNKPSLEVVQKILGAFPDLAMPWLLNGTGPMLAAEPAAEAPSGPRPVSPAPAVPRRRFTAPAGAKVAPPIPAPAKATVPAPAPTPLPLAMPVVAPVPAAPVVADAKETDAVEAITQTGKNVPSEVALFAEPGKAIRRIVIFYRDGTFADYQPE